MVQTTSRGRVDWRSVRDSIDLAAVVAHYLGPAPGRRGEGGRRLWWCCPFHDDGNPSFMVDPGKAWWKCWGCGESGDAATLVMKLQGVDFPEALAILTGGRPDPRKGAAPRAVATPAASPRPATRPEAPASRGMNPEAAAALVDEAAGRLWTPEGAAALAYLTDRGLTPETIRAARLGWMPSGNPAVPWKAAGVVVPWFASGRVVVVKIRPDAAWRGTIPPDRRQPPKYLEAFRAAPPELYPSPETIRPGRPVVIVEGEFDALLLGQALGDRAAVVTLGSASAGPDVPILNRLIVAPVWYVAHDADEAGDKAAAAWEAFPSARRIRPPEPFKDWTEAGTDARGTIGTAVDLCRWWSAVLEGNPAPPLFTGEDLESWRWGPALAGGGPEAPPEGDPDPAMDPYALAEREAIRDEGCP